MPQQCSTGPPARRSRPHSAAEPENGGYYGQGSRRDRLVGPPGASSPGKDCNWPRGALRAWRTPCWAPPPPDLPPARRPAHPATGVGAAPSLSRVSLPRAPRTCRAPRPAPRFTARTITPALDLSIPWHYNVVQGHSHFPGASDAHAADTSHEPCRLRPRGSAPPAPRHLC